jgi:cytokinin dehydrogenase
VEVNVTAHARDAGPGPADDFGHLVHHRPAAVVVPRSGDDIAAAVRRARRDGHQVAAQGRRHSVWGRAQARDGLVLDLTRMRDVGTPSAGHVTVEAGATWRDVLAVTLPAGLTPPVLTDYLDLSVGGTLTVGGVGGTTSTHGAQSDTVAELEVVTGAGEVLRCSADRHADLFDAVRAGLGQVGVIVRATVRLVPAPEQVRRVVATYPDLAGLLADARLVAADRRFDVVRGAVLSPSGSGWTYRLELVRYLAGGPADDAALLAGLTDDPARRELGTEPYAVFVDRLSALEQALRASGQWFLPHPWLTTFVGDSRVEAVVTRELARLDPAADLGPFGQVVLSPIRRAAVGSPMLRLPEEPLCHAFNLIRLPATGDPAEMARLVRENTGTYRRARRDGGTLYPVSAFPMSAEDWRRHLGPVYHRLRRAKQRYDPEGLMTPGYDVFGESVPGSG